MAAGIKNDDQGVNRLKLEVWQLKMTWALGALALGVGLSRVEAVPYSGSIAIGEKGSSENLVKGCVTVTSTVAVAYGFATTTTRRPPQF